MSDMPSSLARSAARERYEPPLLTRHQPLLAITGKSDDKAADEKTPGEKAPNEKAPATDKNPEEKQPE